MRCLLVVLSWKKYCRCDLWGEIERKACVSIASGFYCELKSLEEYLVLEAKRRPSISTRLTTNEDCVLKLYLKTP